VSYTPLDHGLLTSTLLKQGPDVVAVWALILASTDKLGESDMQPSIAASLLRISDERAEEAFALLSAPDPQSKNKEREGRRILPCEDGKWQVVSHAKYQRLASRAGATERQRRYEARLKERETKAEAAADACDEPGCGKPAEAAIGGRKVCTAHAFDGACREPGEEG
jgi:hypothetical protein